ncbi:hypothetical protein SUGI_0457580 [Cryptomeria japonica]|uniref:cyanamide hydratase DDI2-like n=1 Tax=Cryptomeria japonica TaxID=3369 RepID=UPI002408DD6E|nr:cyanamide hydratase DDI2-like [Cryptomeria japonica]GLJ24020.1 hypothetical protein SUGI_0457580 [Cryptomeria japonica]
MASFSVLKELDDLNSLEKQVNEALLKASQGNLIPKPISLASLPLPQTPLAEKATAYAKSCLNLEVFQHSMRSYYFGTAIASQHFPHFNWDHHTAYLASMLHDVGLTYDAFALSGMSFEFHGGILAREFLLKEGASPSVSDTVAEAIFRHKEMIHVDSSATCGHSPEDVVLILGTHLDVYGAFAPLIHVDTIDDVVTKFPRTGYVDVYADLLEEEVKAKGFCTTAQLVQSGFLDKLKNNPVFAKYDY